MNRLKNRLKNNKGFTLAELLITVLILLMVSSVVAGGITVAANALGKMVDAAHAETLLATTYTALRDELSTAVPSRTITVSSNGKSIRYTDSDGVESKIEVKNDGKNDGIYITKSGSERLLISEIAATENLSATFKSVQCNDGIITITDLKVKNKKIGNDVNKLDSAVIRIVGYEAGKAA